MKAIILEKNSRKFFNATQLWQRRHNYLDGNLINSSYPLFPEHRNVCLILEINPRCEDAAEILRAIAVAADCDYFEEINKF